MSVASKIVSALTPIIGTGKVVDSVYNGTATPYIVFNMADSRGELFSDNKPKLDTTAMQIHYFCPATSSYHIHKAQIRKALFDNGFTYPTISELYEEDTKLSHLIFECETKEISEI